MSHCSAELTAMFSAFSLKVVIEWIAGKGGFPEVQLVPQESYE